MNACERQEKLRKTNRKVCVYLFICVFVCVCK